MESDLVSKCIEKALSGRIQAWEEDGIEKFVAIYTQWPLSITFGNPQNLLIVTYNYMLILRARGNKDGGYVFERYVPGDWWGMIK